MSNNLCCKMCYTIKLTGPKQLLSHVFKYDPRIRNSSVRFLSRSLRNNQLSKVSVEFSKGTRLTLSTGKYARLADGCAIGQIGDTNVMVTAVCKEKVVPSSFVPLTVDYRQKAAAAGRIPTNFFRRELGPTENEILVSRVIDRSLRPLFPSGFGHDTQITCNLLAVDGIHDPDVVSINTASAALSLSDIPWNGPIGAVRVGMIDDKLITNPTRRETAISLLNLMVVAAGHNLVVMLEGSGNNVLQQDFLKAIKYGVKECQAIINSIIQLKEEYGKTKRQVSVPESPDESVVEFIKSVTNARLVEIFRNTNLDKLARDAEVRNLRNDVLSKVKDGIGLTHNIEQYCSSVFDDVAKDVFRNLILDTDIRCDGRSLTQLRPISCEIDLYKPLHGSSLFQRGQTQVLCTVALDSLESSIKLDPISVLTSGLKEKNFFLHYDFPSYATNDVGKHGPAVRREVGHGALAEKAIRPVIPRNFPFAVRLTSEVLESNGSSSMASVCGGSLALMDAGVPITEAVSGVAIGLITKYDDENTKTIKDYRILTDILGIEDYLGDMDLKIAGTKRGITAIQADIKVPGLPLKIIMEAVMAGCTAKGEIIEIMDAVIDKHREPKKRNWPVSEKLTIDPHQRGKFMGPGGINLKRLTTEAGVQVSNNEDGTFTLFAPNQEAMDEGKEMIDKLLKDQVEPQLEFGAIYKATIVELREIGVMVTLYDNMSPALLHNSQLDQRKIVHPSALGLNEGDEIQVKYFGRDPVTGQMRLSRKVLQGTASPAVRDLSD